MQSVYIEIAMLGGEMIMDCCFLDIKMSYYIFMHTKKMSILIFTLIF